MARLAAAIAAGNAVMQIGAIDWIECQSKIKNNGVEAEEEQ